MKKSIIILLAATIVMGAVSCKKEKNEPTNNVPTEPTYQEGVYAPLMKIETINYEDNNNIETWNWNGEELTSITSTNNGTRNFTYNDGKIARVNGGIMGINGIINFTYNGDQLKQCTVNNEGSDLALVSFTHAENKINGADVAIDVDYVVSMLRELIPGLPTKSVNTKGIKLSESDNNAHVDFIWDNKNIKQMKMSGDIPFEVTKEMYESIKPYLPLEESVLSMIDIYFLMQNSLHLQISVSDTIDYTYDMEGFNPYFCYMGDVSPVNLSLNNVASASTHGKINLSVNLTGNPTQLFSRPNEDQENYTYTYNEKKYPTKVQGTKNYTITYKQ